MSDPSETPEHHVAMASIGVKGAVDYICQWAAKNPKLVRQELPYLSEASDRLVELLNKLRDKNWGSYDSAC